MVDSLNEKSNTHGGKREGAGRQEGSKNKATIEKKIAEQEFKDRVLKSMDKLITSQMNLAQGCQYLFKINKKDKSRPERITDPKVIEAYLAGDYDDMGDDYYFLTTEKPDNKALDSLIDRVFGKARQKIGVDGGEDGEPVKVVTQFNYIKPDDRSNPDNQTPTETG